jgi:hypothetical protein
MHEHARGKRWLGWLVSVVGCVAAGAVVVPAPAVAAPVVADRAAVVRVAAGHLTWLVRTSPGGGNAQVSFAYGVAGDVPVWGDWNNDGTKTPGVFRNGAWLLKNSLSGGSADLQIAYGRAGDVPVVGDWDGVGGVGLGVVRGTAWLLRQSVTPGAAQIQFAYGAATDIPVVGDWNGNGSDTPGVFRNGAWLLKNSLAGGSADVQIAYGRPGDLPMVGNWDGAGGIGLGVYRGHGQWLLRDSVSGGDATTAFAYGTPSDTPVYTVERPVAGGGTVPPNPHPAEEVTVGWTRRMQYVVDQLNNAFDPRGCGGQATGSSSGHVPGSDHYTGNAADCHASAARTIATGADKANGDQMADWAARNSAVLKIKQIIWYGRSINFEHANPSWRAYCHQDLDANQCANPTPGTVAVLQHMDHVHISVLH